MYFTEIVEGDVLPNTNLAVNIVLELEELPTSAPIRELRVKEAEAKKVDADIVFEITVKDIPLSFASTCKRPRTVQARSSYAK